MSEFPDDAIPGDVARGADGLHYRLGYDDEWRLCGSGRTHPERAAEREAAADERLAAQRRAREAGLPAAAAAPPSPDFESTEVTIYPGEYSAVLAEANAAHRADGWTAARRILFLERLAECGSVRKAAAIAGMTRQAVRKLRLRAPAFAAAYEEALRESVAILGETAFDRAIHGTQQEVYHAGELVGTRTVHHDRLLTYLLRVRDPLNYAPIDELDRWQKHRPLLAKAERGSDQTPFVPSEVEAPEAEEARNTPTPG